MSKNLIPLVGSYPASSSSPASVCFRSLPVRGMLSRVWFPAVMVLLSASCRRWSSRMLIGVRALSTSSKQGRRQIKTSSELCDHLKDPSLLLPSSVVLGSFDDTDATFFPVRNPANPDSILAHVPIETADTARDCVERAFHALKAWRDGTTAVERARLLRLWSQLLQEHADDLATIMTLESGKPLAESKSEVQYGRSFLDYYAAEAVRPNGFLVPTPFTTSNGQPKGQIMALQQAVGVTALLTPWNFPLAMLTRKLGPALAAGCTAVVKPSELTPLTALAAHRLALRAGIPESIVQVVTPNRQHTPSVGHEWCTNPLVAKISFTGSTPVGRQLMQWSSGPVQRLSLELGGNAPFVVFDDADLEQAVTAAVASKFRNAGQTCVCADRFLVQSGIHDDFVHAFQQQVQDTLSNAVGAGLDDGTVVGPLITRQAVDTVHSKVQAAIDDGATCVLGGTPLPEIGPQFYAPTILTHVSTDSQIWTTETFGPVAAIRSFETEEEALRIANDSRAGLASYFCTRDLGRAFRFAQQIESGLVGVNEGVISTCYAPFGGVKESGLGREGSPLGLSEYVETKYVFMNY